MSNDPMEDMPKPGIGCHHTGFEKDCFDLVTKGRCKRWKVVPLEDEKTGAFIKNYGACIDDFPYVQNLLLLKKADNTTQAIQQGNAEAKDRDVKHTAIQAHVLGTVMSAAQRIDVARDVIETARIEGEKQEQLALTHSSNGSDH